jgi:uncharacterized protein YecE (DUF72 family)
VRLLAGTSGYAFKEWKGSFYPDGLKDDAMLAHYATRYPTVEINNTFYRLPKEHVLADWASQVPDGFTFSIKASQRITHFARIKPECESALQFLLNNTKSLGSRIGPILFQLPPNMKKDVDRLRTFLAMLPADRRFTIEFREDSWFDDDVFALLRERDIPMCIIDQPDFGTPVISTASWGYVRLHRFDYNDFALTEWSKRIARENWSDVFVYLKHDEGEGSGPPAVDGLLRAFSSLRID